MIGISTFTIILLCLLCGLYRKLCFSRRTHACSEALPCLKGCRQVLYSQDDIVFRLHTPHENKSLVCNPLNTWLQLLNIGFNQGHVRGITGTQIISHCQNALSLGFFFVEKHIVRGTFVYE